MKAKTNKVQFSATILKFSENGEKTGWTYIDIPCDIAQMLKPGNKKSFRVKGYINGHEFSFIALLPMGNGNFIFPLNAALRKEIGKHEGAIVAVELKEDLSTYQIDQDLIECMEEDEKAKTNFYKLSPSHRNYYSKWIESAKTDVTKAKRIVMTLEALSKGKNYAEMIREMKQKQ